MSKRLIRFIIACLSLLVQGIAYYQVHRNIAALPIPARWEGQFGLLLLCSMALTVLPLFGRPNLIFSALALRAFVLFFTALPLGGFFWPRLLMFCALCVEINEYGRLYYGTAIATLLLVGLDLVTQLPIKAWGIALPVPTFDDRVSYYAYSLLIIAIGFIFSYQNKRQVSMEEFDNRLNLATIELAKANMKLQDYAAMAEQEAATGERKRVAREIHDTLAYTLTNLVMMLEAAKVMAGRGNRPLVEHLERARDQAKNGLADVRRALQALRPIGFSETTGLSAISHLMQAFTSATHIDIVLSMGDAPQTLGEETDHVVYRIVQEGITNALRHGRASEIVVSLFQKNGGVGVSIKDNGIGTSGVKEGYGLLGIRERIERLGGELTIYGEPKKGFILSAWFPGKEHEQR